MSLGIISSEVVDAINLDNCTGVFWIESDGTVADLYSLRLEFMVNELQYDAERDATAMVSIFIYVIKSNM